jgi:hypothetical protein
MNPLKISIPAPCHESWDAMSPDSKGRFCAMCEKTVVDFTGMKAPEISDYFFANSGRKVCGRFETAQLAQEPLRIEIPRSLLFSQTSFRKMFVLALFITMGTTLLSCKGHDDNTMMLGEVATVDTIANSKEDDTLITLYPIDDEIDTVKIISKDTFHLVDREILTGVVAYTPGDTKHLRI